MYLKTLATLCLCVLITACQTRGTYIEEADADAMRTSVETADQLMTKLGKPSVTIPKGEGKTMWVYEGIHSRPGITAFILRPMINHRKVARPFLLETTNQALPFHFAAPSDPHPPPEYFAILNAE